MKKQAINPGKKTLRRKLASKALIHISSTQQVMGQAAQCAQVKKATITSGTLLTYSRLRKGHL